MNWPTRPIIYEIHTYIWLNDLSQIFQRNITLANVPTEIWDAIAELHIDAVWLMGIWERSPLGRAIAMDNSGLVQDFSHKLPDFDPDDNVGSAYCIRNYKIDAALGSEMDLSVVRQALGKRGIRLILDFVPNHCALDHAWVAEHPDYFIRGNQQNYTDDPTAYFQVGGYFLARGRDPNSSAWPDVAQLNLFSRGLRDALMENLRNIAQQCDGLRCDMAMLVLNDIFKQTWALSAGEDIQEEFWTEAIRTIRKEKPDFLFIAECYWDTEWQLQQLGFDFCYDKRLYDRLVYENAESIRTHLTANLDYQAKLIRFIENHDESRATVAFGVDPLGSISQSRYYAAAIIAASLPGAKLFYEGQFEGRQIGGSVFLRRRFNEIVDTELAGFYARLLKIIDDPLIRKGDWNLLDCEGWPENQSFKNLLAWAYSLDGEYCLIVVNFSSVDAQGAIKLPWTELLDKTICLNDLLHDQNYQRVGIELISQGLFVEMPPWGIHWFSFNLT